MKHRVILGVIALIIATYIVAQGVRFFVEGYYTETPYIFTVTNTYATQGIILRDEEPISKEVGENLVYVVAEGERVLPHTVVAKEYATPEDRRVALEIMETQKMAEKLNLLDTPEYITNISQLTDDIVLQLTRLANSRVEGEVSGVSDIGVDLLISLAKANLAVGGDVNIQIKNIQPEPGYKSYNTGGRGIFSSYVDGYEKELTPKLIENMSFDTLDRLLEQKYNKTSGLGKLLKNINWYYVCEVDYYNGKIFQGAGSLLMTFPGSGQNGLSGTVEKAIEDKANDRTLLIISSKDISPDALGNRTPQINFAFPNYRGIRFSKDALRVVNGKQGVYTMGHSTIQFKTVDIIYTGSDFYLSRPNYSIKSDELSVFDEVIVRGRDLYDGKPLE